MAQKTQQLQSGTSEMGWLSHLVETFETISRTHAPCAPIGSGEVDSADMAALMAHLGRPTSGKRPAGYAVAG